MPRKNRKPAQQPKPQVARQAQPTATAVALRQRLLLSLHAGPLPDPETLAKYDLVVPGFANRIVVMAERQQEHRHGMERTALKGEQDRSRNGLQAGFVIVSAFLAAAVWLIASGYSVEGTIIGTIDIVSLASAFLMSTIIRKKERSERLKRLTGEE